MTNSRPVGALSGLRVLDLSERYSFYCGKLFVNMGAEVILVESPKGGSPMRRQPPFFAGEPGPDSSIPFFYFNADKKSITLDLDEPEGQEALRSLVARSDLLIEDALPGVMARRGLDYPSLRKHNPALVYASITPFGQSGPYASYPADDLTLLAMGGFLHLMGDPDAPPVRAYGDQSYLIGSLFGAVGSMMALLHAQSSGEGQQVDVSIQECIAMALETAAQAYDLEGKIRTRFGSGQRQAGTGIFPCADGYIYILAGGMAASRFWKNLVHWLRSENHPDADHLAEPQWSDMSYLDTDEAKKRFLSIFGSFCESRTKEYLYYEGQRQRIPICPVSSVADLTTNRQLAHREFFRSIIRADTGTPVLVPGGPYQLSETPWQSHRGAPVLGEHNAEVLAPAGMSASTESTHQLQEAQQ